MTEVQWVGALARVESLPDETVLVATRLAFVEVEGDQCRRKAVRQISGNAADGSGLALHVEQREASLRGRVKARNPRDAESLLKRLPHVGREAVYRKRAEGGARSPSPSLARRASEAVPRLPHIPQLC